MPSKANVFVVISWKEIAIESQGLIGFDKNAPAKSMSV